MNTNAWIDLYITWKTWFKQISRYWLDNDPKFTKITLIESEYNELKNKLTTLFDSQDIIEELLQTKVSVSTIMQ